MTDTTQPKALTLANACEALELHESAKELRRLHARVTELEAHVQKPAEIEHVAGDVSKNSAKKNMNDYAELPEPDATTVGLGAVWNRHSMRDFADATHALRTQQPAPATQQAVGNSGFDYKTAADFLSGKTVSDEALRKFVAASRGAHDDRTALRAQMLALRGVLASREAEIALLKRSLLDAEAAAPPPSPAAQAAPAAGAVAGWQWVPTVPTEEMCRAMDGVGDSYMEHGPNIWAAMLAAAPQPLAAPATQQVEEVSESQVWRCFHCEEVFTDKDSAALHFGSSERQEAYCTIPVEHFRWMEEQQRRYFEEDTESHRTIRALHSQSFENARRSEERGYARGLEDAKKHPQELGLMAAPQPSPTPQAADSVLEDAALSGEQQRAIFEAHESAASEGYFEARPQIDCNDRRRVFKAGYERGWDAARKQGGA